MQPLPLEELPVWPQHPQDSRHIGYAHAPGHNYAEQNSWAEKFDREAYKNDPQKSSPGQSDS